LTLESTGMSGWPVRACPVPASCQPPSNHARGMAPAPGAPRVIHLAGVEIGAEALAARAARILHPVRAALAFAGKRRTVVDRLAIHVIHAEEDAPRQALPQRHQAGVVCVIATEGEVVN
jgi:hypothetical protein